VEEVLAVIFQVAFEIGFQVLISGGVDLAAAASRRTPSGCGWAVTHAVVGGLCGWLSALMVPHLVLPYTWLRIANLVVGPLVAGGLTLLVDRWLRRGAGGATPFWHGFGFALAFGLARFAFAAR
jgi:hypothetical protein